MHKYFQAKINQGTTEQKTVARYGLGLITLNEQKYKEAEDIFQALAKQYPEQPQYATALARCAVESKNFVTALERYKKLIDQFPDNAAIKLEYISTLLKTGATDLARKNLVALSPKTQQSPIYWQFMAQVYSNFKQPAESHRYLAEYYYSMGQTKDAILQIRLAQESSGLNFQLSSILNERLNFFIHQEQEAMRNQ